MLVLCESTLKLSKSILILAFKQMAMSSINKEELLSPIYQQSWTKLLRKLHIWGAFFLNFVADRFFPPPLPLEAVLLGLQKKAGSLSICRKQL